MTDPACDCCWRPVTVNEYTSNCFCVGHGHGDRRPMTGPVDHQARMHEIEGRLEAHIKGRWLILDSAPADLRYLLDRVRTLEAGLGDALSMLNQAAPNAFANGNEHNGIDEGEYRAGQLYHRLNALLPAPETVETQG